ncbi:bile acid 7-alpha-dehydratase [Niastella koreensis]|nr:nuclear transport factor 2 family protein [Niastella koreensis]OQP43748.1 bile acid 7-alpha-dehydratase [Niastella koreensis]
MNSKEMADKAALKELIDEVAMLADKRDVHAQVQLFTENAISDTYAEGNLILGLKGRTAMEAAFTNFLKNIDTVYHFNGQQQFTINGDNATGTSYCMITLIGMENGKKMKTSIGAVYQDDYVYENNHWLIAKRTGDFQWQEKREVGH